MSGLYITYPTVPSGGSGVVGSTSIAAIGVLDSNGASPNGATVSGANLVFQSASATNPGIVSSFTQTFAGVKTFSSGINVGSTQINAVADPTTAQQAATKNYVDTQLAAFQPIESVFAASTANIANTYLNGAAGVGATLVPTATGALSLDGVSPTLGTRVLIKNQTNGFENGVYDVTLVGSIGVSPILTRSLDYNTPSEMNAGDLVPVVNGTVNQKTSWLQTATIVTIGSDNLTFVQYSLNPTTVVNSVGALDGASASPNAITVGSNSVWMQSGSATNPGIISSAAQTFAGVKTFNVAPKLSSLSISAQIATDGSGQLVSSSVSLTSQVTGNLPLSQTSGSASLTNQVSGLLPVANGGTGLGTLTLHSVQIGNGTGTPTQLVVGSSGLVLQSNASNDPTWASQILLGSPGAVHAYVGLANGNANGKTVFVKAEDAVGADYNFNLPVNAGSSSFVLTSGGGGSSPMTWSSISGFQTNPMTAKSDMIVGGTSGTQTRFAIGSTDGSILTVCSSATNGIIWTSDPAISNVGLTAATVGSALQISMVTANGVTQGINNPSIIPFRSPTGTNGTLVQRTVTSSVSITIPQSATLGNVASVSQYVWVYAIDDAGVIDLGVSGNKYFDDSSLVQPVVIATTSNGTMSMYSGVSHSGSVSCKLIGRVLSNQNTAGTWVRAPLEIAVSPNPQRSVTDWMIYKLDIGAVTTAPVPAGQQTNIAQFRRNGSNMEIQYTLACLNTLGSNGSGNYLFPLPNYSAGSGTGQYITKNVTGYSAGNTSSGSCIYGPMRFGGAGITDTSGNVVAYDSFRVQLWPYNSAAPLSNSTSIFTTGQAEITFQANIPIYGWSEYGPIF